METEEPLSNDGSSSESDKDSVLDGDLSNEDENVKRSCKLMDGNKELAKGSKVKLEITSMVASHELLILNTKLL